MTRNTIASPAMVEGTGLHLGQPCALHFKPAKSGNGITLRRTDIAGSPAFRATVDRVLRDVHEVLRADASILRERAQIGDLILLGIE